jgi:hypothetical protein
MGLVPHVKFKYENGKFGVHHKGREGGPSRTLILYKFDGDEWNRLEEKSQEEATGSPTGHLSDQRLVEWGKRKADFYI